MSVQSIRGVVEAAIQRASSATGVDFSFLLGAAKRESGFNPGARAAGSSAAGLFQFVDQTWLSTLKQHGAKYGYARYAELIQKGADGKYHVEGAEARRAVMDLRLDPHAASLMAGELASDHASYLRGRVGREPTGGELYAAHFLGPQGSARLIEAARNTPHASAAGMFPDAAASNHPVFYRAGRAVSVSELYTDLTSTAGSAGATAPTAPAPVQDTQFLQYASARRIDRLEQEQALIDIVLRGPEQPSESSGARHSPVASMFSADMLRVLTDARRVRGE
jgi:hypothetical protein